MGNLRPLLTHTHAAPPPPPHTHTLPQLCKANYKEHQQKQCAEPMVEKLKCGVKLMRAVDFLCRPQFTAFTACLKGAAIDKAKCLSEATAWDMCTESW